MNLNDWAGNGWIRAHKTSKQEIKQLFEIIERDLHDAQQRVFQRIGDLASPIMQH